MRFCMTTPQALDRRFRRASPHLIQFSRLQSRGELMETHAPQPASIWLIHADRVFDHIVRQLQCHRSAIVLRTGHASSGWTDEWPADQSARLQNALSMASIRSVIVVGHGRSQIEDSRAKLLRPTRGGCREVSVLQRTAAHQLRLRHARESFAEGVRELHRWPSMTRAVNEEGLSLCGLWYLPESGFWLRFSPTEGWSEAHSPEFEWAAIGA